MCSGEQMEKAAFVGHKVRRGKLLFPTDGLFARYFNGGLCKISAKK